MTDQSCRWLAFGVFALGTCAAAPFFKKAPPAMPLTPSEPARQFVSHESGDITLQVSSAPESAGVEPASSSNAISPPSAQASRSGSLRSLPSLDSTSLPSLPAKYTCVMPESFTSPLKDPEQSPAAGASDATRERSAPVPHVVGKEPVRDPEDSDGDGDSPVAKPRDIAQATRKAGDKQSAAIVRLPKVEDTPSIVRHRVVDGDSLEALAAKYLGAAKRADEIYRANRERLASPELLPIGVELSITLSSNAAIASADAASPAGSAAAPVAPATALVPLTADEIAQLRRERN